MSPKAVADTTEIFREDLKTCPGGYVEVRKLTYGQLMNRRSMNSKMKVTADRKSRAFEGELDLAGQKITEFDFKNCLAEHNLEDEKGRTLDFKNPSDVWLLDPRIGEEISQKIEKHNQFNADEEDEEGDGPGNSENGSGTSSSSEKPQMEKSLPS